MRSLACLLLVSLSACGGRVLATDDAGDALALDDAPLALDTASFDTLPTDTLLTDAGLSSDVAVDLGPAVDGGPTDPPPDPTPALDCFGDVGPTDPKSVRDVTYQREECGASTCHEIFRFDPYTCVVSLEGGGFPLRTKTMDPTDCVALGRWLGSTLFQKAQKDGAGCSGFGPKYESTELHLWPDTWLNRKAYYCPVEPFVSHRACFVKIKSKYFPAKTI